MKITRNIRLLLQLQKIIFTLLLLSVVGLLSWASQKYSFQYDWTAGQRNTLSQGSINLLRSMKAPVVVNVYLQEDPTMKTAVSEILNRYKQVKDDFNFRLINPDLDIALAEQDRVTRYGQAVIKYKNRSEVITSLSEGVISSALQRLSHSGERTLLFLEGHGERQPAGTDNADFAQFTTQLAEKAISANAHNLLQAALPDDTDVLVIASPTSPVLEGELEHIREHIIEGGNLLWMMDPGAGNDSLNGLSELARLLNIKFLDGIVVDNNTNLRQTLRIQHPAMIPVLDYYPHVITQNISYNTLFPISRGVTVETNSQWQSTIIAQSLAQSWSETNDLVDGIVFDSSTGDVSGPLPIVIALERPLPRDTAAPNSDGQKTTQRIIVTGDSDFLANSYLGVGANLTLGLNIIDWLSGDDDLIATQVRNAPDTKLQLDDTELLIIGLGFLIVLPAGLLMIGLLIWFMRRKR